MPPNVGGFEPLNRLLGALDHEYVLDARAVVGAEGFVNRRLEYRGLATSVSAICGDHELCTSILDARCQRVGTETAEHHRVNRSDASDGKHRDDRFWNVWKVDGNAVALGDTEVGENVCRALYRFGQALVGVGLGVTGFALKVNCYAVAATFGHVTVEAVVGNIDFAIFEPLGEGCFAPVQSLGEWLVPVKFVGLLGPETQSVLCGLFINGCLGYGLRSEFGSRRKHAVLFE